MGVRQRRRVDTKLRDRLQRAASLGLYWKKDRPIPRYDTTREHWELCCVPLIGLEEPGVPLAQAWRQAVRRLQNNQSDLHVDGSRSATPIQDSAGRIFAIRVQRAGELAQHDLQAVTRAFDVLREEILPEGQGDHKLQSARGDFCCSNYGYTFGGGGPGVRRSMLDPKII